MNTAEVLRRVGAYPALLGALMLSGHNNIDGAMEPSAAAAAVPASLPEKLVFVSNRSGKYQIYLKNLVTKKLVNLSRSNSNDMNAQPSPDGKRLVFYSDRTGNNQIYQLSIDRPGQVKRITHDSAQDYDPVYMPDGRILYKSDLYGDKGLGDIWIMNADGSDRRDLTPETPHTEEWKPEPISDTEIIYTSRAVHGDSNSDDLFKLNIDTGAKIRLTNNNIADWFPSYSPAAGKIAFISKKRAGQPDAIFTMDMNGKKKTMLTDPNKLPGDSDDPAWSPDGRHITFLNNGQGGYSVYVIDAQGNDVKPLDVSPSGDDLSPIFLP